MNIYNILLYLSVIVWAIIPFRQLKKDYFFYFLAWISADIITLGARFIFHSTTNFFYVPLSFLALIALQNFKSIKKQWLTITFLFLGICLLNIEYNIIIISVFILHILILISFLKELIIHYVKNNLFSIFLLALIFYEITVVAKFLNYLTGFTNDYYYFIITTIFEIAFGVFFIILKADDERLIFQFK